MARKQVLKKAGCLLIAGSLSLSIMLSGCGSNNDAGESSVSTTSTAAGTSAEASKEPGIVKIMTIDSSYLKKNYDQDLPVFKEVEKNLNIKLEWQLMPNNGYDDALKIKLSAGSDMPDIFVSWSQNPETLAQNGAIVAMSDYFDTTMKNTQKVIAEDPNLKVGLTSPDGKVYFLPRKTGTVQLGWLIRQDWLDKLNLKVPETMDDFYNVLKAFKDQDPNENGKKDEVALAQRHVIYSYLYSMQSWGLSIVDLASWVAKDKTGEYTCFLTRPEFKENLTFLNKLFSEKLLNQDILTINNSAYDKLMSENRVGVTFNGINPGYLDMIKEANPGVEPKWTVMLPPTGPNGDRGVRSLNSLDCPTFIAKNGKNIEDATRFLDYIFADPEGRDLMTYGIKGLTYNENNGEKVLTDIIMKNPEGLSIGDARNSMGMWPMSLPGIQEQDPKQILDAVNKDNPWIVTGIDLYNQNNLWSDTEPKYRFTTEEVEELTAIKTGIQTYVDENVQKMIVGAQSLDTFDKFAASLKEKNIDRIVEIYNQAKARTK